MEHWLWLALCVFLGYTVATVTGFGAIVVALSLGAFILPIDAMLPVFVPLTVCMNGYLLLQHYRSIHWPTLLKMILPLMVVGMVVGWNIRPWFDERQLRLLFGVLVMGFASWELWRIYLGGPAKRHATWWTQSWIFSAGVTHGIYAAGGPLLVYALTGVNLPKAQFRATLLSVWFCLNTVLTLGFAVSGSLQTALPQIGLLLPVLVVGIILGEWLHKRVNEHRFRIAVFWTLLVSGGLLISAALS